MYKSITVYINNKKVGDAYTITEYQRKHFILNKFSKNKQEKLRHAKKNEIKEKRHLNYTTAMIYAFCLLVCFFIIYTPETYKRKCVCFVFIF